jgi:hypothetical protein
MATQNHQKLNGAAKRSGRSTKSRSLAAIMAGATLGGVLAAGGALGFIESAKAATALSGNAFIDINSDGLFTVDPAFKSQSDIRVSGVVVTAYTTNGAVAGTATTAADGSWTMTAEGNAPYRLEFTNLPQFTYEGFSRQNTAVQFTNGEAKTFGLYAKLDGFGQIEDLAASEGVQIGDRVWADTDGNGRQDPGEAGIDGVRVELLNATGQPYLVGGQPLVSVTEAGGLYVFNGIPALQQYQIRIAGGQPVLVNYDLTAQNAPGTNELNNSDAVLAGTSAVAQGSSPKFGAIMNYDFGYKPKVTTPAPLSLGDYVFVDANNNGIQDGGDQPVGGATVDLLNSTGVVIQSKTTGADGKYLFTDLVAGSYRVRFTRPAGVNVVPTDANKAGVADDVDSDAVGQSDSVSIADVNLTATNLTVDAGWRAPVAPLYCVGDQVWDDTNKDGLLSAGEVGVGGVGVALLDASNNPVPGRATTTSADGKWQICGLPNGAYRVRFTKPAGYDFTKQATAANDGQSSADVATGISLPGTVADKDCVCLDAGLVKTPVDPPALLSLGDTVWIDANDDGLFTPNESTVPNALVELLNGSGAKVGEKFTDSDGRYLFTGLTAGSYQVRFTRPVGSNVTPAKSKVGTNDIVDSDGVRFSDSVSLTAVFNLNSNNLNVDAGWVAPSTPATGLKLGDLVFIDTDRDGLALGKDLPVEGALVELLAENGTGTPIKTTTSDANGKYLFTDLTAGKYRVRFTRPAGTTVTPTTPNVSADGINDSNGVRVSDSVSLTGVIDLKADDLTIDAGWVTAPVAAATYCLGDIVFDDLNGNGTKEDNEPGVNGIVATVTNSAGVSAQTTTANGGLWKVCGLSNGNFTVAFTRPNGYEFTVQGSGNNKSNVDSSGKTGTVTINNADNLAVDAGIKLAPIAVIVPVVAPVATVAPTTAAPVTTVAPAATLCIGDKVFVDATGSAKDGKGISGVTVTLVRPDGTTATATTDANGAYKFCALPAGAYTVKVNAATLPAGAVATYDLVGKKVNEATVTLTNADNNDLDFGYKLADVSVLAEAIATTTPAPVAAETETEGIAFTGQNSTTTMLWGLALLMMGTGIAGLMVDRRRSATR